MNALVVGSGGREHAIAWALAKSPLAERVICVPGNAGTERTAKCRNAPLEPGESLDDAALRAARGEGCGLAVVGPEEPLARGLADRLREAGVPTAGPGKREAALEAGKDYAKRFMARHGVACARGETFRECGAARSYLERAPLPIVVKADGLAAGKGVVVAFERAEALEAVTRFMEKRELGRAGETVVIEEYLSGAEYSVLAAVSGGCALPFLPARDHKRLLTGNRGPNTGGMGAVCPAPGVGEDALEDFRRNILQPTLAGFRAEGFDYRGFLFFGVMLTAEGSRLLEYNVRLGDPETQAALPLMKSDFAALCLAAAKGRLDGFPLAWKAGAVCAPVAVSGGYPGRYETGVPVSIDEAAAAEAGAEIFAAGLKREGGALVTAGGRVLCAAAEAPDAAEARKRAYAALRGVKFPGMYYREDIGAL